jgi:hypothetical protein
MAEESCLLWGEPGRERYQVFGEAIGPFGVVAWPGVFQELRERDERGRDRAYLLLQPAADAIVIDSTSLTLNEVLNRTEDLVRPLFA